MQCFIDLKEELWLCKKTEGLGLKIILKNVRET